MKKILVGIMAVMLTSSMASAAVSVSAKCTDDSGKMQNCKVDSEDNSLKISFKSKKLAELNRSIGATSITRLSSGEFTKQRVAEALLLSPLFLLSKRHYETITVEYSQDNKRDFINITTKEKDAQLLRGMLETMTGKTIETKARSNRDVAK